MRLGSYELVRQIGAGGMGEVWIAHHVVPGRPRQAVAIKRLPRRLAGDPEYRRILLEEARLSQLLRHANIIHTIEAGEADGEVFIAMELVEGLDLSRINKLLAGKGERFPVAVAAYITAELLRGLAYAHNLEHEGELISLIHRDVSPHNVMLSTAGAVKLADFGVARLSSEDTSGTHVKGKARYMPPEQLRGDSRSPSVDLFAVGAVMQELLDGALFRGDAIDDARLLGMAMDGVVPPPKHPRELPPELDALRRRLLSPDPEQRPRSAQQALELLARWSAYRPKPKEVAAIVERLRLHEAELTGGGSQTGLAHQDTFLHTNDLELDSDEVADMVALVEAPDQILLALATESSESAARIPSFSRKPQRKSKPSRDEHTAETRGRESELDRTAGSGPAATGGHEAPPRDPSLALDLAGQSFARHVPTSPNPTLPERRALWPLGVGVLAALGAGLAGAYALGMLTFGEDSIERPETTLRQARVAGRGSLLDLGLRHRGLDRLVADDIRFHYGPDPSRDPLAALVAGEVEFALTDLGAFLEPATSATDARASAKIVAVVGVPLASEALILDTRDHPELQDLGDLSSPTLVATASARAALVERLDEALAIELEASVFADDAAAFAELERDDSPILAAVVREPWIAKARAAGMTVVASALDLPRVNAEILVARTDLIESDPALVEAVVARYYAGVHEQQADAAASIELAAAAHGLDPAEAQRALAGVCPFDGPGAMAWVRDAGVPASRIEPSFTVAAAGLEREAETDARGNLAACLAANVPNSKPSQELGALPELDTLPFESGAATLSASAQPSIDAVAERLRVFNPSTVAAEVIGFGDRPGPAGRKLGRERAERIVEALRIANVEVPLRATGLDNRSAPISRVRVVLTRTP